MKRLLLLLALVLLVLPVQAGFSYNFQNPSEFGGVTCTGVAGGYCSYAANATGGNSNIRVTGSTIPFGNGFYWMENTDAEATTYAAATMTAVGGGGSAYIILKDSVGATLHSYVGAFPSGRYEVIMDGNLAKIYGNGVLLSTSAALATNPYYVGFGTGTTNHYGEEIWDDFVYGASESKTVFGNPEQNTMVVKDMITPASSGLMNMSTGTVYSNYNMSTSFSRSNTTIGTPMSEETAVLMSFSDGSIRQSWTLRQNDYYGQLSTSLPEAFFNTGAPYGAYTVHITGSSYYPNVIYYVGRGATVTLDQEDYARGDTATATYSVTAGYWLPATYTYTLEWMDLYGTTLQSTTLSTDSGSVSYTFADDADIGQYYAVLKATPATGSAVWMGFDNCALGAYITIRGWVNDAETMLHIPGARVNFMQSGTANYITTFTVGNYTTNASYLSGAELIVNVSATGYRGYQKNFTPIGGSIDLNFTLWPNPPIVTGLALGGVVRDGDNTGSSSTNIPPRPIPNATVTIKNLTHGESYTVLGNKVGAWLLDETKGAFLTSNRLYHIEGDKTAYRNSSIYKKVVVG